MPKLLLATALAATFLASGSALAADKPDMFVFLTSPDPQTQGMALVLTTQAVEQGRTARILLCGPAGDLGLQASESPALKPRDVSPKQMLQGLIGKGVPVEVCALFLPNAERTEADLLPGITAAKPPVVAQMMLEPTVRWFAF